MLTLAIMGAALALGCIPDQTIREIAVPATSPQDKQVGTIRCTISTPDKADLKKPIPVVIVFPPGPQNSTMEAAARAMFFDTCMKRGWALATPQPPEVEGAYFFNRPEYLDLLVADLDKVLIPEGNAYYAAGASNGGRSALAFALRLPTRTAAVAAFPGALLKYPPQPEELEKLRGIPVRLWCGGDDTVGWLDAGRILADAAKKKESGLDITFTEAPGQGHVIRTVTAETVLDELEKHRTARKAAANDGAQVQLTRDQLDALATLDNLHAAAARADFDGYFSLFTPDAVFIGTDADERWSVDEFKAYARPVFVTKGDKKGGWTYRPRAGTRHVSPDPSGTVIFFDELLDNDSYGTTRGTGVLRKVNVGGKTGDDAKAATVWRVAQYSLSIPIPNPLAKRVAAMIKTEEERVKKKN